jgi:hypothetical protein
MANLQYSICTGTTTQINLLQFFLGFLLHIAARRGGRFLDFLDFQPAADVKCYSKTKVERAVLLYFMSSFAEMRFLIQKIT